jgi:sRNA-binding protein
MDTKSLLPRHEARAWLEEHFPLVFGYPIRPLALGCGKEITAAAVAAGLPKTPIARQIKTRCHSRNYLRAMIEPGAMRYSLSGEPIEPVSQEHVAQAREELERLLAKPAASPAPSPEAQAPIAPIAPIAVQEQKPPARTVSLPTRQAGVVSQIETRGAFGRKPRTVTVVTQKRRCVGK